MSATILPKTSLDQSLISYMQEIKKFPMLSEEEEYSLANSFAETRDARTAHKLVTSHLRLVVKIALGFRGYGLPIMEMISEGNIGLMQAVKKFDPAKGFRLSTYAIWWIKASINEYVLRSWSLVKMGTTSAQKRIFFNLKRIKSKLIGNDDSAYLTNDVAEKIADNLKAPVQDVIDMDKRMTIPDKSINAPVGDDDGSNSAQYGDFLASDDLSPFEEVCHSEELAKRKTLLSNALSNLNERERQILVSRKLTEIPKTLEELSLKFGISKERVRQIEAKAIEKISAKVKAFC